MFEKIMTCVAILLIIMVGLALCATPLAPVVGIAFIYWLFKINSVQGK